MDRSTWLAQRRADVVAAYDAAAPEYSEYPNAAQRAWVDRLLDGVPDEGVVLDAPCGTGRYFEQVAAAGKRVVGIDQSGGMLAEAKRRNIAVALHHVGLQELDVVAEFDAAMTIDAMENVSPEDWPLVLANLHRAVRPGGKWYLTVEETAPETIDAVFARLQHEGQPAVRGEIIGEKAAGYHFYPDRERVLAWFSAAGWHPVAEDYTLEGGGWGYRHFLLARMAPG